MNTWDDFIALFDGLTNELNRLTSALKRIEIACKNISNTYNESHPQNT